MMDTNNSINALIWNANSLRNKLFILYDFLRSNDIKIACICETFLLHDDILHRDADYVLHRLDRDTNNDQRGGGVMLIVHRSIKHILLPKPPTKLLEAISVDIVLNNNSKIQFSTKSTVTTKMIYVFSHRHHRTILFVAI